MFIDDFVVIFANFVTERLLLNFAQILAIDFMKDLHTHKDNLII